MKLLRLYILFILLSSFLSAFATRVYAKTFANDTLIIDAIDDNAYRIRRTTSGSDFTDMPYPLYTNIRNGNDSGNIRIDEATGLISVYDNDGNLILKEIACSMTTDDEGTSAKVTWTAPDEKAIYGTGQFQDGYLNVKGLTRRLTQVNTQIALPMIISDRGYGILWNNSGLTQYNPSEHTITLQPAGTESETIKVNATGTEGNRQEVRSSDEFIGQIDVPQSGMYALILDCGQSMARKHYLEVDGKVLTKADNIWLPPTTSVLAYLNEGKHDVVVKGDKNDHPTLAWRLDDGTTTFASPISEGIDYTIFIGSPDQIIQSMRRLTGDVPMLPKWALGYVHCRERYDTQTELLDNAKGFRDRNIPIDMIVQDWQWWGSLGWNAMHFDPVKYPDPKAMTDSLHAMDMKLMLSVWAKVDKNSELGKEFSEKGYYIPGTDWIDFFSEEAADGYWTAYRENLLPTGIDAWWQDATEPENDDLHGRMVNSGSTRGDVVRNIFPLIVNDHVYRGLTASRPDTRPLILTRSGAPGIQRYGVFTWSGDVGNDWQTLQRQISGGLSQMACGLPWWTYDAGGFFRPGDQYSNEDYQKRMLRWIQTSALLPMMRVHGYMSQTEPWRYTEDTYDKFIESIRLRYCLVPYLYTLVYEVSDTGSTMMRPLVFDFADDAEALKQDTQYMLGKNLLVCPVISDSATQSVYLPEVTGGWYDLFTGEHNEVNGYIDVVLSETHVPVYVKAGSILPWASDTNILSTSDISRAKDLTIKVYPGADGEFTLYEDDGVTNAYADGDYRKTHLSWDDTTQTLSIDAPIGSYDTSIETYTIVLPDGTSKEVSNTGEAQKINLKH